MWFFYVRNSLDKAPKMPEEPGLLMLLFTPLLSYSQSGYISTLREIQISIYFSHILLHHSSVVTI